MACALSAVETLISPGFGKPRPAAEEVVEMVATTEHSWTIAPSESNQTL
jgi:hypothetical protein